MSRRASELEASIIVRAVNLHRADVVYPPDGVPGQIDDIAREHGLVKLRMLDGRLWHVLPGRAVRVLHRPW